MNVFFSSRERTVTLPDTCLFCVREGVFGGRYGTPDGGVVREPVTHMVQPHCLVGELDIVRLTTWLHGRKVRAWLSGEVGAK